MHTAPELLQAAVQLGCATITSQVQAAADQIEHHLTDGLGSSRSSSTSSNVVGSNAGLHVFGSHVSPYVPSPGDPAPLSAAAFNHELDALLAAQSLAAFAEAACSFSEVESDTVMGRGKGTGVWACFMGCHTTIPALELACPFCDMKRSAHAKARAHHAGIITSAEHDEASHCVHGDVARDRAAMSE